MAAVQQLSILLPAYMYYHKERYARVLRDGFNSALRLALLGSHYPKKVGVNGSAAPPAVDITRTEQHQLSNELVIIMLQMKSQPLHRSEHYRRLAMSCGCRG